VYQRLRAGSVTELAEQFGVSEVTIRADLQALAARNLIVRTHGGAVPLVADCTSFLWRIAPSSRSRKKIALAQRARRWFPMNTRLSSMPAAPR